jgi:hypothetical protein
LEFAREGGVGQPIDVAKICVYMASDATDFADWHDVKME